MTKLCARGKSAAKRKFKVYPSAYANAYASKICAGKIKDPSGTKRKDWGPKKANEGVFVKKPVRSANARIKTARPNNANLKYLREMQEYRKLTGEKNRPKRVKKMNKGGINTDSHMQEMKKGKVKINKVIKGLKKASKLHAGQAKSLGTIKLARGGGAAIRGLNFQGVK